MVSVKCKEWLAIKEKNEDENRRSCTCREDIVLTLDHCQNRFPTCLFAFFNYCK